MRKIEFNIINQHDYFNIIDEAKNEKGNDELSTNVEYISVNDVAYPELLGGGECGGCPVVNYFNGINHFDTQ